MKREWIYFQNPFLTAVERNFKKAVKISEFHDARLQAASAGDPFVAAMYAAYHPLHVALVNAYNTWKASGGTHKGATLTLVQLLQLLSPSKIGAWDAQVQVVHAKGTSQYVTIFPQGHKPFQTGSQVERKGAVEQLSLALTGIVALAATKTDVDAFAVLLNNAIDTQEGDLGNTDAESNLLTVAIKTAMEGMYANLGSCITNSPADATVYEPLFDLETVRHHEQTIFTGELNGNENHVVLIHKFAAEDELKLTAFETPVKYYLAAKASDPPIGGVSLAANGEVIIHASQFGNLANRYLHVVNNSALPGHFKVELL